MGFTESIKVLNTTESVNHNWDLADLPNSLYIALSSLELITDFSLLEFSIKTIVQGTFDNSNCLEFLCGLYFNTEFS